MSVKTTKSVSGKLIRLTDERFQHIKDRHPEIGSHLSKILQTVHDPDLVTSGWFEEVIAIRKFGVFYLAVVYREEETDGFVITAFLTRSRKYFEKRGIIWSKR